MTREIAQRLFQVNARGPKQNKRRDDKHGNKQDTTCGALLPKTAHARGARTKLNSANQNFGCLFRCSEPIKVANEMTLKKPENPERGRPKAKAERRTRRFFREKTPAACTNFSLLSRC